MPDSAGVFSRLYRWTALATASPPVPNDASHADAYDDDVAAALNNRVTRDGTSAATADLPMANHSLTGIRQAAANGEPMEYAQVLALIAAAGGGSNLLDNASFMVNQRGVSGTVTLAAGVYGHDRWKAGAGGCTYSFGQSGPDVGITITSGSLLQVVPVRAIDAGTYTLQNAGTAQGRVYQGAVSALGTLPSQTPLASGSTATVEFGTGTVIQPQLSLGTAARTFARRALALDMVVCQALFEVGFAQYSGSSFTGNGQGNAVRFRTTKLAVPTVTVSNYAGSATQGSVLNLSTDGFTQIFVPTSNSDYSVKFNFTASCEP